MARPNWNRLATRPSLDLSANVPRGTFADSVPYSSIVPRGTIRSAAPLTRMFHVEQLPLLCTAMPFSPILITNDASGGTNHRTITVKSMGSGLQWVPCPPNY